MKAQQGVRKTRERNVKLMREQNEEGEVLEEECVSKMEEEEEREKVVELEDTTIEVGTEVAKACGVARMGEMEEFKEPETQEANPHTTHNCTHGQTKR